MPTKTHFGWKVWGFALGYFSFYMPYSSLAKLLSQGRLSTTGEAVPGFIFLPATALATTVGMLTLITLAGGWSHMARRRAAGYRPPLPSLATFVSGLATAAIIATTTLNYTSRGIS